MATKGDVSDLEVLMFGGKPFIPLQNTYSVTNPNGVIQTQLSGGASRQRKKFYNGTYIIPVTYELDQAGLDFMQLFFGRNEGKKFIAHLAADRPIVEPYVVQVVGDWSYPDYVGFRGQLSVEYEVYSARDKCLDDLLSQLYPCMGSAVAYISCGYKRIVERMPNAD